NAGAAATGACSATERATGFRTAMAARTAPAGSGRVEAADAAARTKPAGRSAILRSGQPATELVFRVIVFFAGIQTARNRTERRARITTAIRGTATAEASAPAGDELIAAGRRGDA